MLVGIALFVIYDGNATAYSPTVELAPGYYDWSGGGIIAIGSNYKVRGEVTIDCRGSTLVNSLSEYRTMFDVYDGACLTLLGGDFDGARVITHNSSNVMLHRGAKLVAHGSRFRNSYSHGLWGADYSEMELYDSIISSNSWSGIGTYGSIYLNNCDLLENIEDGVHLNGSWGKIESAYIVGSRIYDNGGNGIGAYGSVSRVAIEDSSISRCGHGFGSGRNFGIFIGSETAEFNMKASEVSDVRGDGIYVASQSAYISEGSVVLGNGGSGVVSYSSLDVTDSRIEDNTGYDLRSYDRLGLAGAVRMRTGGIYLPGEAVIDITAPLSAGAGEIGLTIDDYHSYLGRKIASMNYSTDSKECDKNIQKFDLRNTLISESVGGELVGGALLRSGIDTNGARGDIILSRAYRAFFDKNISNNRVSIALPDDAIIYWKEAGEVATSKPSVYYDEVMLRSLELIGYVANSLEGSPYVTAGEKIYIAADEAIRDVVIYARYSGTCNLYVRGNGATSGSDYMITNFCDSDSLPDNSFRRIGSREYSYYDGDRHIEVVETEPKEYSYVGWNYSSSATYRDNMLSPSGSISVTNLLLEALNSGAESVADGMMDVYIYAIWDACPMIRANWKYISKSEARSADIIDKILDGSFGEDDEDGIISGVYIDYMDEILLHNLEGGEWMIVRLGLIDGFGNKTTRDIRVYISDDGAIKSRFGDGAREYIRFVDERSYSSRSSILGGLMDDSIWYQNLTYASYIEDSFSRGSSKDYDIRFELSGDNLLSLMHFVEINGIGDAIEDGNLTRFLDMASCDMNKSADFISRQNNRINRWKNGVYDEFRRVFVGIAD